MFYALETEGIHELIDQSKEKEEMGEKTDYLTTSRSRNWTKTCNAAVILFHILPAI